MTSSDVLSGIKVKSRRVKTPTILQMDAAECGAVSLSIIMAYYGRYLLAEEARTACGVSRDGSKAINMIKAARRYGMIAEGENLDFEEVLEIELPCIVYWEFNHFVVLEGFSKNKVYINDPATGPRAISYDEFDRSYTGIVLTIEPGPKFKKGGRKEASVIKQVWERIYGSKGAFVYMILITLLLAVPAVVIPIFTKIFIDHILIAQQKNWILPLLGGMAFTGLIMTTITWLQQRYLLRFDMKVAITGSANFFWHLLHLPMNFFQQRASGDIAERVEVNDDLAEVLSSSITGNIVGVIMIVLYVTVMVLLSWRLTVIAIAVTILNFLLLLYVQRRMTDMGRRFAQDSGKLSGIEMHGVQIIETIKANALENQFFTRWASYHAKTINSQRRIDYYSSIFGILPALLKGVSVLIILTLGTHYIIEGDLTVGTLVALQSLIGSFNAPVSGLLGLGIKLQQLKGDVVRLNDVLSFPKDSIVGREAKQLDAAQQQDKPIIEIKDLSFGYSKLEPPVYDKFSLTVKAGERIAIVGPSGSGKSSLAKLLCGLYEPWAGEILLSGRLLAEISREELASFLALVDQRIFLFAGSVRDNLTLWNPAIPDEDCYQALKDACMDDVIASRGGLDCMIAEDGGNFSGGQCQRLEIARALTKNPQLLVLDEATSAMDPIVEKRIYDRLKQRQCTLFIVAHRLSTIRDCDQILVIEEGLVTQRGTHEQLIQEKGLYSELATLEEA